MTRFLALYTTPSDPAAFDRHYHDVHVPLAKQLPGLRRYTISRNVTPLRGEQNYYLVAELEYDDMEALRAAFASPQGQAAAADVANLTAFTTTASMIYEIDEL